MKDILLKYTGGFQPSGQIEEDVKRLLLQHSDEFTYVHVKAVAKKSAELAKKFDGNLRNAEIAAWLHDVSAIIPNDERITVARALKIEVLPEEETLPMIIHQKLSSAIAEHIFGIDAPEILRAIGCHTTLKANASVTDKLVFVADKIAWDQPGKPPYLDDIQAAVNLSLDAAALVYLNFLWSKRNSLAVLHPWVVEARDDLMS